LILIVIYNSTDIMIAMNAEQSGFGYLWETLISREHDRILRAYESLQPDQKIAILEHLQKMVSESGWQPEQRNSAQAALDAIPIV
jgi:hypothetical protein